MRAQASVERVSPTKEAAPACYRELSGKVYDRWDALPKQSNGLFDHASSQSVFLSRVWFENLSQTSLQPNQKLQVFSVESSSHGDAPLLFLPASEGPAEVFGPRVLSSLANFYSPLFSPLISPDCDPINVLRTLTRTIANQSPRWDVVNLRWLDNDSQTFGYLLQALKLAGFAVQTYFCSGNWYEPICGRSYEEYLQGLKSSVRNIARSKAKKIERSGCARIEVVAAGEGLPDAIQVFEHVYNSSWRTPEPYPQFIPGLLHAFAAAGWLRLGIAYWDGEPAAAQIWFVANRIASIYKIAYDQKFKDLSVGSYLTMHMFRHAIEVEKVTEIDYLTGDDRYKQDWMSQRRERWGILAMNSYTPKGVASIVRHVGGRAAKRMTMRILGSLRRQATALELRL